MQPVHYFCPDCDHPHFDIPAIARIYPDIIAEKIHRDLPWRLQVGDDICRVLYPKPRRNFIRANLDIPVIGETEPLQYGLWVELSDQDFTRYQRSERQNIALVLEGRLANEAPDFPGTFDIPVRLVTRPFPLRPLLHPIEDDNDLWRAYDDGVEDWEAQMRLELSVSVPGRKAA